MVQKYNKIEYKNLYKKSNFIMVKCNMDILVRLIYI